MTSVVCGEQHTKMEVKLATLSERSETRHRMNMWFLRILGGAIILLTSAAITVGLNLNNTLVKITNGQAVCEEKAKTIEHRIDNIETIVRNQPNSRGN